MRSQKHISESSAITTTRCVLFLTILGVAWFGLTLPVEAQRRTRTGPTTGSDDVVFAISFSPDGRTLAIARGAGEAVNRYGRIELWDTETGKLIHLIKGFDGPVWSVSFSPDGLTLISASTEFRSSKIQQRARSREGLTFSELKWWNTRTGELKQKVVMPGEDSFSIQATQSPDGKQLALAETFREQYPFFGTPSFDVQSPIGMDGSAPARSYMPRSFFKLEMKLVDAQTGDARLKLDVGRPGTARFSPDGSLLAVLQGKEVKLWNAQSGKEVRKLKNLNGTASAMAFSPNGRTLAVASTKYERESMGHLVKIIGISEIKLIDVATGKVTLRLNDVGAVNTLAFSPDGRVLLTGGVLPENHGQAAGMKIFDLQTGKVVNLPTGADYKEAVDSMVFSPNGGLLAFRSGAATVKLLDTLKGTVKQTWDADSVGDAVERPTSRFLLSATRMLAVSFSADGATVSGESDQGEIKSWDHRTGEVKRILKNEQDDPSLVAASTDGKSFAEINQGDLLFWNANSETKTTVPFDGQETATALALSGDGRMLAIASRSEVTLLSAKGEVDRKLIVQEGIVSRLTFSSTQHLLAGADQFGNVRIWNVESGRLEKTITTQAETTAIVFAPNGQTLATADSDNTISLWNLQTGLALGKFQKHDATINALAFSPNGQWLASGGDDRTIVLWELAAGKSRRTFKGHDQTVTSLAFSPDSGLLASGSGNASVVIWEVDTGKLSRVLR